HTDSIGELAAKSDVLFLAAKPKDMAALIDGIATQIKRDSLVITLAAGVRTAFVQKVLAGRGRAVRIMPNLPCAVGEGATAFALGKTATEHDALTLEEIRSEEHTSELQSRFDLVCRLLLEKKKKQHDPTRILPHGNVSLRDCSILVAT